MDVGLEVSADATNDATLEFELSLEVEELDDVTEDALYESHDVLVSTHGDVTRLTATVPASDPVSAALALLDQVAAVGATPSRFVPDLVTRSEIASRAGVSRQAVSNWTRGERKSAFPPPLAGISGGLWCYGDVVPWLTHNLDDFDEPCRHLTWDEFSEIASLANAKKIAGPPFPGGAIAHILNSSQQDSPSVLASRIWALIEYAASGGLGQRDPVSDLLEVIARDASVAQRSVIVDSLPTLLQLRPESRSDPDLDARTMTLSMYFANSLGSLATERDKVRIEKVIKANLDLAVTRKEVAAVSAVLASLAFSPFKVPTQVVNRAVDLVGVPAHADAFLAMLASSPETAVTWLLQPRSDDVETSMSETEAVSVLKYSIILMSKSRTRHASLASQDDRATAIKELLAPLVESLGRERDEIDQLVQVVGDVSSAAATVEVETDTTILDSNEREQVEQFARFASQPFEYWPPIPSE